MFDALVIGGGPAGSLSSLLLARLGWRTALIERRRSGATKTCGHCLGARGAALLEQAGLADVLRDASTGRTSRARVRWRRRVVTTRTGATGWLVPRDRLDPALQRAAADEGVEIVQPAVVVDVSCTGRGAQVTVRQGRRVESIDTALLVGADGAGSRTARWLGLDRSARRGRKYGFAFDLPEAPAPDGPGIITLHVTDRGYVGTVAQDDGLHVAGLVHDRPGEPGRDPFLLCREVGRSFASLARTGLAEVTREHVVRLTATSPMPWRPRRAANACGVLVGDAAGYIEPFTGEGMTWAFDAAVTLASVAAAASPGHWTPALARRFEYAYAHSIRRRQWLCRLLTRGLEQPIVRRTIFGIAPRQPRLVHHLAHRVTAA